MYSNSIFKKCSEINKVNTPMKRWTIYIKSKGKQINECTNKYIKVSGL